MDSEIITDELPIDYRGLNSPAVLLQNHFFTVLDFKNISSWDFKKWLIFREFRHTNTFICQPDKQTTTTRHIINILDTCIQ